jgi:hypothetical protein
MRRAANSLRALRPMELQDPMVAFSIFASVTITRAGMFTTLAEGLGFISRLLKGFMIGFAVATGVSLLILPITSRGNVFHDIKGYVTSVEGVLQSQISFVEDSSTTGLLMGRGLLRRARTAMSTRDMQIEGEPGVVESKQNHLQASMRNSTGCIVSSMLICSIRRMKSHGGNCQPKISALLPHSLGVCCFRSLECRCCQKSWR